MRSSNSITQPEEGDVVGDKIAAEMIDSGATVHYTQLEWEKEFDKTFVGRGVQAGRHLVKAFISSLLASERAISHEEGRKSAFSLGRAEGKWLGREEERTRIIELANKMKGENALRLNTFKEGYKDGWNAALTSILSTLEANDKTT